MNTATVVYTGTRDDRGRVHFSMEWNDDPLPSNFRHEAHPKDGQPVGYRRGECFHADPEEHVKQLRARGVRVTVIGWNGSKWAGESPDAIDTLLDVLAREPLDRRFGDNASAFISRGETLKEVRFFGNFLTVSHAFGINSDDPEVIKRLTRAIEANVKRPDFRAQPSIAEQERARKKQRAEQLAALRGRRAPDIR